MEHFVARGQVLGERGFGLLLEDGTPLLWESNYTATAQALDPRFDVVIGEDENTPVLGLVVGEGTALQYNVNWQTPYASSLGQGLVSEQDLTSYKALTQNDWRGGRGQEVIYTHPTNRYRDAMLDTRFNNMAVLLPRATQTKTQFTGPSFTPNDVASTPVGLAVQAQYGTRLLDVPQFLPSSAGVIQSEFLGRDGSGHERRVRAAWEATEYARYLPGDAIGQRTDTKKANLTYTVTDAILTEPQDGAFVEGPGGAQSVRHADNSNVLTGGIYRAPGQTNAVKRMQLLVRTITRGVSGTATVEIRTEGFGVAGPDLTSGFPSSTVLATGTLTLPPAGGTLTWVVVTLDQKITLEGAASLGSRYWIVLRTHGDGADVIWSARGDLVTGKAEFSTDGGGHWQDYPGASSGVYYQHQFKLSDGKDYTLASGQDLTQSVKVGNSDRHVTRLRMRLAQESWQGDLVAKVQVCSDLANSPGAVLKEWTVPRGMLASSVTWAIFEFGATQTLTANSRYWITLLVAGCKTDDGYDQASILWECDTADLYADGDGEYRAMAGGSTTVWVGNNVSFYCELGNMALAKRRLTQSFTMGTDTLTTTKVQLWLKRDTWTGGASLSLSICVDAGDAPGAKLYERGIPSSLIPTVSATKAALEIGPRTLTAGAKYWIVLEPNAPAQADAITLTVLNDANHQYSGGHALLSEYDGTWGLWFESLADIFFVVNDGPQATGGPLSKVRRTRSFTLSSSTTVSKVALNLSLYNLLGNPTVSVAIYNSVSGAPGTVQRSATISPTTIPVVQGWTSVALTAITLAAGTYWLVVEVDATSSSDGIDLRWYADANNGDAGGDAKMATYANGAWGGWQSASGDLFFIINDGESFSQVLSVRPVTFGSDFFLAVGALIYKLNKVTQAWVQTADLGVGGDVTALVEHAGTLYVARGDSTDMQSSADGTAWSAMTDRKYTHLLNYGGYLYALKGFAGSNALSYYVGDTATWADVSFGLSTIQMTGMVGFRGVLLLFSTVGMYELLSGFVTQSLDWSQQRADNNGAHCLVWGADGLLYLPIRNSLNAYDGQSLSPAGLDQDEGLPEGERGPVAMMSWTTSWLLAAVDAGTSGMSGVYAKVTGGGWHRLAQANLVGQRITVIAIESVTDPINTPRLWFNQGGQMWYLSLPDWTDNPYTYQGSQYQTSGYINGSRWLGELAGIDKDLQSVLVRSAGCGIDQWIDVSIEVDRSGHWIAVGTVTQSPEQEIELVAEPMANKTCAAGCTERVILVDDDSDLADMEAWSFVRIGREVRQVQSVDSGTQFTLARALADGAPAKGTLIVTSRPAGREVAYRLELHTTDITKTPQVKSVSIRYMEQMLDKARIWLGVPVQDKIAWRTGATQTMSGAELYDQLVEYGRRLTPFYIWGPDGIGHRVKVAGSMGWNNIARTVDATKQRRVKGTLTMQLMEV